MRVDIQALRAISVLLVVVFHLWPEFLPGGFVGVDAFFVVSGYLITSHLRRELDQHGSIRILEFWARRARRLLPASFLVLFLSLCGVRFFVPASQQRQFLEEIGAAVGYILNWKLLADAVEYSAADNTASPVQHFWSLSVEEQFYLLWPLALAVVAYAVRRQSRVTIRTAALIAVSAICGGSLLSSVMAISDPGVDSYFPTWNRAWEFGSGALLSFVPNGSNKGQRAGWLGSLGFVGLVASAVLMPKGVAFPGYLALAPVSATLLVLAFGDSIREAPVRRLLHARPVQWLGDVSYGVYLWHWPLIVLAKIRLGGSVDGWPALAIVVATGVLAAACKRLVEDPVRFHPVLVERGPWLTLSLALGAMALLLGCTQWALLAQERITNAHHALWGELEQGPIPCFGALAERDAPCINEKVTHRVLPHPSAAKRDARPQCMLDNGGAWKLRKCNAGAEAGAQRAKIALIGDSHAAHFAAMLDVVSRTHAARYVSYLKGSCPFSRDQRDTNLQLRESCEKFKRQVRKELRRRKDITTVVLAASARNQLEVRVGQEAFASAVAGYREELLALPRHVKSVIVLRDVPRPREDVIQCLELLSTDRRRLEEGACVTSKAQAVLPDPLAAAASELGGRFHVVDFTDEFCDHTLCRPIIGNALAYRDGHHLTRSFAMSLAPLFEERLSTMGKLVPPLQDRQSPAP